MSSSPTKTSLSVLDFALVPRKVDIIGVDGIPSRFLKACPLGFGRIVTSLINKSISEGTFPALWKRAIVTPIPKKKCDALTDYRPISVLPVVSKILERVIHNQLTIHLLVNELLSDSQSGFRAGHSTQDVLLHVTEKWRQDIDEGRYVGAGFLDLKKAFDCVNHKILLEKALYYGIRGIEMKWLTSYLSERSQQVCLNGNLSESGDVTIGVPQGSILGPLLFVLYTNDMPRAILHSCINMYADDTEIHYANKELSLVEKRLQEDLYALESWMSSNRLKFNVKKSCIMLVGTRQKLKDKSISVFLSGLQLEQVMHIKYLGLIIDSHLKWDEHINYVLKRVRNKLDSIGRLKPLPPRLLTFLYLVYVLPIFDYCDIVWSPSTINKAMQLERLHHKVTRNLPTIKQRGFSSSQLSSQTKVSYNGCSLQDS